VVVGAGGEDSDGTSPENNGAPNSGAAYAFVRDGAVWSQQAYLKASNAGAYDAFGAVAISGDTMVVGAVGEGSDGTSEDNNDLEYAGAVYVFTGAEPGPIPLSIDIQFCGDSNAINCKKKGAVPVTIFGGSVDVGEIDVDSLRLCLASDPGTCIASGPKDFALADRGNPATDLGVDMCMVVDGVEQDYVLPDGETDLDVAFDAQEVAALIGCDNLSTGGNSETLILVGETLGGQGVVSVPVGDMGIDQLVKVGK